MEITNTNTTNTEALKALDELENQFSHWRQNKSFARESIPLDLLQSAKTLSNHIGHKVVRSRLGISSRQLQRGDPTDLPATDNQQQFVQATAIETSAQPWHVEVHMPTGAVVTICDLKANPMTYVKQLLEQTHDCA